MLVHHIPHRQMFTVVCGITAVKIPVVTALVMTAMAQAMFHSLYNTSRGTIGKHCNFTLGRLTCHAPQHVVEESVSEHRSVVLVSMTCRGKLELFAKSLQSSVVSRRFFSSIFLKLCGRVSTFFVGSLGIVGSVSTG